MQLSNSRLCESSYSTVDPWDSELDLKYAMEVEDSDPSLNMLPAAELSSTELPTQVNTELSSPENAELANTEVPELYISKAVVEILLVLFSGQPPDSLEISVKSTRKLTGITTGSWFYIKVSTSSQIDCQQFSDCSVLPCLLEVLEKMQQLETESHLCIQSSVGGVTLRRNLILQGTRLVVQQETSKQKPATGSSLYLRVHQNPSHMLAEAQSIYKLLQIVKIFTPRVELQFNMKIGDVVCKSKYRASDWLSISPEIPDIVSVAHFYTYKSSYKADSDYVTASVTGPDTLCIRVGGAIERSEVTCLGLYLPVVAEAGLSSIITLTLLGPGWFPVDISVLWEGEPELLGDLNLSKLGLRAVSMVTDNSSNTASGIPSCHWKLSVQSTTKHVPIDKFMVQLFLCVAAPSGRQNTLEEFTFIQKRLSRIIEQSTDRLCCIIRDTLHKTLQTWIEKTKTRTLVYKSIRSASKAVRDIVTLSNNEEFRQEIYGLMQVESTTDLEQRVQTRLTNISKRRHYGVWGASCSDSQQADEIESSQLENQIHVSKPNNEKSGSSAVEVQNNKPQLAEKSADIGNEIKDTSRPTSIDNALTKTPEVNVTQKDVEDVSPFQQLAEDLMDVVDNICEAELVGNRQGVSDGLTELGGNGQLKIGGQKQLHLGDEDNMHEEPYVRHQTDDEIMAQLFYENEKDMSDVAEIDGANISDIYNQRKTIDSQIKFSQNEMGHQNRLVLNDMKSSRPEVLAVQKESRLKRSFSFPKDKGQGNVGSAKFYRALSGDKLVPRSLSIHQDPNKSNNSSDANQFQCQSFHPASVIGKAVKRQYDSIHQDDSVIKAETAAYSENHITDNTIAKDSDRKQCQSLFQFKNSGVEKDRKEMDSEFQDTFDVISQFVDDCVEKELIEIGGTLDSCHIQSQAVGNEMDQNNNSVKDVDCVPEKSDVTESKAGDPVIPTAQTDSDDWFDAAVADIENWFN